MTIIKPCPFCGGVGTVSFRQLKYLGQNEYGDKKIRYAAYVMCHKCHARGSMCVSEITTDGAGFHWHDDVREIEQKAVELWNDRPFANND